LNCWLAEALSPEPATSQVDSKVFRTRPITYFYGTILDNQISIRNEKDCLICETIAMELLVFHPGDANPKNRQFNGPLLLALELTLGGIPEVVPGLSTISLYGMVRRCTAYCDKDAKQHGKPVNTWATSLWHLALKRQGFERGLRRSDGTIADWLGRGARQKLV